MRERSQVTRLGGRHREAAVNDQRILEAGLRVLIADPHAPISAIADAAGVGVASLYRRFSGRDELARRLALEGMTRITAEARAHRERLSSDPWETFAHFIHVAMTSGAGSMTAFAGTFDPGDDVNNAAIELTQAIAELLEEAQDQDAVRRDITPLDLLQLFQMLRAVHIGTSDRDDQLRIRYMDLLLPSLRHDARHQQLGAPAPTVEENMATWNRHPLARE